MDCFLKTVLSPFLTSIFSVPYVFNSPVPKAESWSIICPCQSVCQLSTCCCLSSRPRMERRAEGAEEPGRWHLPPWHGLTAGSHHRLSLRLLLLGRPGLLQHPGLPVLAPTGGGEGGAAAVPQPRGGLLGGGHGAAHLLLVGAGRKVLLVRGTGSPRRALLRAWGKEK
jgi:hypothetical protein